MDLVVHGLPVFEGKPLFCDVTLLSPIKGSGEPRLHANEDAGRCIVDEERRKSERYREVADCDSLHWQVLGHTIYGYTRESTRRLLAALARHKASKTNMYARKTGQHFWCARFWDKLSCKLARSVAAHYRPTYAHDPPSAFVPAAVPYLEDLL